MVVDDWAERFYTDLIEAGSLTALLRNHLPGEEAIRVESWPTKATGWTAVRWPRRKVEVPIGTESRSFGFALWHDGCRFGSHRSGNLAQLSEALTTWLSSTEHPSEIEHPLLEIDAAHAKLHASGPRQYVQGRWKQLSVGAEAWKADSLEIARTDRRLSGLSPFWSMMNLCFSAMTDYPFDHAPASLRHSHPTESPMRFWVDRTDGSSGEYDSVTEALAVIAYELRDFGPARHGDASAI